MFVTNKIIKLGIDMLSRTLILVILNLNSLKGCMPFDFKKTIDKL